MSKFGGTKYRHIVGSVQKKELWYPDLKLSTGGGESTSIASSTLWVAVASATAGSVNLLALDQVGKRKTNDLPTIFAHSSEISDLQFSPFSDDLLATSADDGVVKLFTIPSNTTENITNATASLSGHRKRVDSIRFHPTANNIIASGSTDKSLRIWDIQAGKEQYTLDSVHTDGIHAIDWNYDGSLLVTVAKDKKIRVIDPRSNQVVQTGEGHQGVKASRVVWLGEYNKIATTGFNKLRERQFALWDSRDLSKPQVMTTLDSSTGIVDLHYDVDTNILVLAGKGDSTIKLVEIQENAPHYTDLTLVQSDTAQKSTALIPKRAVDLMNTEVMRILKLTSNAVAPVTFTVPRKLKSEFQEDLYPPTKSPEPVLSAQEWFSGENKAPKKYQLKPTSNPHKFWEDANTTTTSASSTSAVSPAPTPVAATTTSTTTTAASPTVSHKSEEKPALTSSTGSTSQSTYVPKTIKVVRSSKFRHINGKGTKMDDCYTNLKIASAANNSVIRVNPSFFCVPWSTGTSGGAGLVAVLPMGKVGRQKDTIPLLECGSPCLDFDWNPFDDQMLATVTENALLQIWKIPTGGITKTTKDPDAVLKGHLRRVTSVDFHPNVANLVITSSGDNTLRFWDLEKNSEALKVEGPTDMVQNITWNWDGSIAGVSSKDRELRLYDPRANNVVNKCVAHEGAKGFKAAWLGRKDRIATVGYSKTSERQMSIWDIRSLSSPLGTTMIDTGSGLITPFYDPDTSVMFLCGKGDGNIKMYEIEDDAPFMHYLTEYNTSVPAQGMAIFPKTHCNVRNVEIARFFKLASDYAEPITLTVPRTRTEFFQDDLFPPTKKIAPTMSASEWLSGKNKDPETVSLHPSGMKALSEAPVEVKGPKYTFNPNQPEEFTRDKMMDKFYQQMGTQKEEAGQVLKQDLMEGVDESEWDD